MTYSSSNSCQSCMVTSPLHLIEACWILNLGIGHSHHRWISSLPHQLLIIIIAKNYPYEGLFSPQTRPAFTTKVFNSLCHKWWRYWIAWWVTFLIQPLHSMVNKVNRHKQSYSWETACWCICPKQELNLNLQKYSQGLSRPEASFSRGLCMKDTQYLFVRPWNQGALIPHSRKHMDFQRKKKGPKGLGL